MDRALRAKFPANSPNGRMLLDLTGSKMPVEHVQDDPRWDDKIWGCGKDGVGENRMGVRLKIRRDQLRGLEG